MSAMVELVPLQFLNRTLPHHHLHHINNISMIMIGNVVKVDIPLARHLCIAEATSITFLLIPETPMM